MSEQELRKIVAAAAKHILPEGYLDRLQEAARRHGRPFATHQQVGRITPPSRALRKLAKVQP